MTATDLAALAVIGLFAFLGYRRGAMDVAASFVAVALGLGAGYLFGEPLATKWPVGPTTESSRAAWFLFLFAAGQLSSVSWMSRALRRRYGSAVTRPANRWLGTLPGAVEGALLASMMVLLLLLAPQQPVPADVLAEGPVTGPLLRVGTVLQETLYEELGTGIRELVGLGPPVGQPDRRYPLPATTHKVDAPEAADELFRLLNEARGEAGLPLLERDPSLDEVAREHCLDMWSRGYFGHSDPEGRDVAARMEARRLDFLVVGENLALAPSAAVAHRGLMDSPGHRSNILSARYHRGGVGAVRGPSGLTFTQVFRD